MTTRGLQFLRSPRTLFLFVASGCLHLLIRYSCPQQYPQNATASSTAPLGPSNPPTLTPPNVLTQSTKGIEDVVSKCEPITAEEKEALAKEISHYQSLKKFHVKIEETRGNIPYTPLHTSIMNYLQKNVFKSGWSILDLGAAAGGMLKYAIDIYKENGWKRGSFHGVELVTGWVAFTKEYFSDKEKWGDISFVEGDITEFTLQGNWSTFDFVMLNDVMEHLQPNRYGCFFEKLKSVTHEGSVVYMHTPTPEAQVVDQKQFYENVLPHHLVVAGMALAGFELVAFEHDQEFECSGEPNDGIPRLIERGNCYRGGWLMFYHIVFFRTSDSRLFELHS